MGDFFTLDLLIRLVTSFVCSIAFAVMFKINKRHLLLDGVCGFLTYFAYYTVIYFLPSAFGAAYISTLVGALCAELFARIKKAPTSVFLIPAVIPTVPGSNLYFFMQNLLDSNFNDAVSHLITALGVALGIAAGTVTVSIIFGTITDKLNKKRKKKQC